MLIKADRFVSSFSFRLRVQLGGSMRVSFYDNSSGDFPLHVSLPSQNTTYFHITGECNG
jgi:hypothetical protein